MGPVSFQANHAARGEGHPVQGFTGVTELGNSGAGFMNFFYGYT